MTFTHINEKNQPAMVDVGEKIVTRRSARAQAVVHLPDEIAAQICDGELSGPKGPVFQTAIIAGTMAAKKTSELIPFCHPLLIERCDFSVEFISDDELAIRCEVAVAHKTGVEMEALTGASVAALTVYDMCKALSHEIVIADLRLLEKSGGKRTVRKGKVIP